MATPEGKVKTWTDNMLKREKVWYFSPQAGPYGQAGIPDRIGVVTGLFFAVECKADASKKMTALQERCKEMIEAAGGKFFLVYDKETIEEVRQWIVSARSGRQAGSNCSGGRSCRCDSCVAFLNSCAQQLTDSASQDGRDQGSEQPRVQRSESNPLVLQIPWEI